MGCTQSKIENEEAVSRCKDRKQFMKEAVTTRNAFAAAHSAYTMALKNTGAALSDYGQGEVHDLHHHHASIHPSVIHQIPPTQPSYENLPPPPPPLPNFSPAPPLKRANTMPEFSIPRPDLKSSDPIQEDDEEEEGDGEEDHIHDEEEQMEEDHDADHDLTHRRSRGGGGGGGGSGRVAESAAPRPPPSPPRTPPTEAFPPPPPEAKGMTWDYFFMVDNIPGPSLSETDEIRPSDNDESDGGGYMNNGYKRSEGPIAGGRSNGVVGRNGNNEEPQPDSEPEPRTPEKVIEPEAVPVPKPMKKPKQVVHSNSAPVDAARRGGGGKPPANNVSLMKILSDLDDHFLRASESAHEVSKMLEATRLHYHSNFADNRGHIDHSARVMRVITWNRSFRGLPNGDDGKDDFDAEEHETHATVLDKLLAWEKKLYDEVKAGELMKLEYQRKVTLLNKQKKRGASTESLEKTKAAVSHLHTRYIVDMQSMDSTVSEINHLRDDQLYPKLVALVDGMAKMWDSMHVHHDSQLKNVFQLRSLDVCQGPKETSEQHHERTAQLCGVVQEWHSQFQKLVSHQKEYIQALNSWLKLNLIPIESSLKEKVTSPPRPHQPAIQPLIHAWHEHLEKLPAELAGNAIFSFAGIIKNIILHQEEEAKLKEKCEETRKEFTRKSRAFEDWYKKYIQCKTPEEMGSDRNEDTSHKDEVAERQFVVESLKKKLDEETEAHQKHCRQVREKSLGSLKTHLPELFRAMSDFSSACSDMYKSLQSLSQPRRQKQQQQQRDPSQS